MEYVPVAVECQAPVVGYMPDIDRGALWDALGDDEYRELEQYIDSLWSLADEQGAIIEQVCGQEKAPLK